MFLHGLFNSVIYLKAAPDHALHGIRHANQTPTAFFEIVSCWLNGVGLILECSKILVNQWWSWGWFIYIKKFFNKMLALPPWFVLYCMSSGWPCMMLLLIDDSIRVKHRVRSPLTQANRTITHPLGVACTLGQPPNDLIHKLVTWGWPGWAPGMTSKLFERTGGRPVSTQGS